MNKKQRKKKKAKQEAKNRQSDPASQVHDTKEDTADPKEEKKETKGVEKIAKWARVRQWIAPIATAQVFFNLLLTAAIAGATIDYSCYAGRQWNAMVESNKNLQTAFKTESRASISVTNMIWWKDGPPYHADDYGKPRLWADIGYDNQGRSPAKEVRVWLHVTIDPSAVTKMPSPPQYNTLLKGYPTMSAGPHGWAAPTQEEISESDARLLLGPTVTTYLYGVVQYTDIFEEYHETGFCYYRQPHGKDTFFYCPFGNWYDQRPKQP